MKKPRNPTLSIRLFVLSLFAILAIAACTNTGTPRNRPPVANFTVSPATNGTTATTFSFDGSSSSDPDGNITTYSWNMGDGSPAKTGATTTHSYAAPGSYSVALTVTDNGGLTASRSVSLTVAQVPTPTTGSIVGRVRDTATALLDNANVSFGARSLSTDAQGQFSFTDVPAGVHLVTVAKAGYAPTQVTVNVMAGESSTIEATLLAMPSVGSFAASDGGSFGRGGSRITFAPNSIVTASGAAFNGQVNVAIAVLDASDPNQLRSFPGDFTARTTNNDIVLIESFGAVNVELSDNDGNPLDIAPNMTALLEIPVSSGNLDNAPERIPFWFFDQATGLWIEQGVGQIRQTDQGSTFQSEVPRVRWWNADIPYLVTCLRGRLVVGQGQPVTNGTITAAGVDYNGITQAFSGPGGNFAINVKIDSEVNVSAISANLSGSVLGINTPTTTGNASDPNTCLNIGMVTLTP